MTRYIQRHSLLTRVTHGVAAVSCILLAITGVFVFVPSLGGGIMGGDFTYAMRMLHRILAIPFILIADGALVFFCFFLAVSGMVMWLNTGLLPDGSWKVEFSPTTVLVAHLVHDVFFFLTVFVGIAHIYLGAGIFQPYRGTARIMFGDGKVSESDAAYHWGYWANEEIALGKNVTTVNDEKDKKSA
ncbi:formate dehydrogenase [Duodenibacillus massiliensis]|uniref:formate dehydrogenase n=1 Tax=Duodenibacillus massiliensis TaxID=1852381 RepID=UPI003077E38A